MSDFTDGTVASNYLSSFWSQLFSDPELVLGIGDSMSKQIAQLYQNFAETVNATSVATMSPFHTELVYPIFIKKSKYSVGIEVSKYGDGAFFGPQPAGGKYKKNEELLYGVPANLSPSFYFVTQDSIAEMGATIINRLYNPSVILANGSDFSFVDGLIIFREDIFENDLIPKRTISGLDGSVDYEIILWATSVKIEKFQMYQSYGNFFFNKSVSGPALKSALVSIFSLYSGGPSIGRLDSFVAAASGFPVSAEVSETVESINNAGDSFVIVTDKAAYRIDGDLTIRPSIKVGSILTAGEPLTTATEVNDRVSDPMWWSRVAGIVISEGLMFKGIGDIGFFNNEYKVDLSPEVQIGGVTHRPCKFYLAGTKKDVDSFWKKTEEVNAETGEYLSHTLWTSANLVNSQGDPDYTKPLYVNPIRILNDLIGDNLIIININKISSNSIPTMLELLRQTTPSFCTIVILINVNVEDSYSMMSASASKVDITTLAFVDGTELFNNNVSAFTSPTKGYWQNVDSVTGELLTKYPEALSLGISPDTLISDTSNTSVTLDTTLISESVSSTLTPSC